MQEHVYSKNRPETLGFLERFRTLIDKYDAISLGELTAKKVLEYTKEYTEKDKRLHMVYTFSLLTDKCDVSYIRKTIKEVNENLADGWVCWAFGNHDVMRVASRWNHLNVPVDQCAKLFMALLLSLRGAICMYQGEELGLTEAAIAYDDLQDPYGIRLWPEYKGRDGCRTPMPWHKGIRNGGFSEHTPWLPIPMTHLEKSVDIQEQDAKSVLNFTRRFLSWRKNQPAIMEGDLEVLDTADPILAFKRLNENQDILIVFNFSDKDHTFDLSEYGNLTELLPHDGSRTTYNANTVTLAGFSTFFAEIG